MNGKDLKKLREIFNITQLGLSEATSIPLGTIGRIEASGDEIKKIDVLHKITRFFNIEENEEPQQTIEQKHSQPRLEAKPLSLADPEGEHRTGEKIYELPDGQKVMEVKIIPAKAQAGYRLGYPDPEYYEDLPTLTIHVNGNHRGT